MKKAIIIFIFFISFKIYAQRTIISLNGIWNITESVKPTPVPTLFDHSVQVPGLADLSVPPFKNVNLYDGVDYLNNSWVKKYVKDVNTDTITLGISEQQRNYFWYKKEFVLNEKKDIILLKINKAQFGTYIWVNGKFAGKHLGCFTAGYFDITSLVNQPGKNTLIVRIGAHPGVLPPSIPSGSDYEKSKWTPGIYDDVSIIASNFPFLLTVLVAPDIYNSTVKVQSVIINKGQARTFSLDYKLGSYQRNVQVSQLTGHQFSIGSDDTLIVTETIPVPGAQLWTPENPNLYVMETSSPGDETSTRFGMRDFRFDTKTKKAYLNGKIYYLRGSNITLHRFFEDDNCGNKPWDDRWVRKLLIEWPHKFHWNSFRFCIGPVPDKWLNIADESGLLIQNEFFIWPYHEAWDTLELKNEINEWMRDNENHPSVAWWDICNETDHQELRDIISRVRMNDLSDRAWDNGYGLPVNNNDPVEDHNYLNYDNGWKLGMFETHVAAKTLNSPHPTAHACVLNEYGWLWLHRDGSPTLLTRDVYNIISPGATNGQRIELAAYLLGIETEYFRAHRNYAGVLHFDFLTGDYKNSLTGDLFSNIDDLSIHPEYTKYLVEAFRPLGVFIDFTADSVNTGKSMNFRIMLINDEYKNITGSLQLKIADAAGNEVSVKDHDFEVDALGEQTVEINMNIPATEGNYVLTATASSVEEKEPTVSLRKFFAFNK